MRAGGERSEGPQPPCLLFFACCCFLLLPAASCSLPSPLPVFRGHLAFLFAFFFLSPLRWVEFDDTVSEMQALASKTARALSKWDVPIVPHLPPDDRTTTTSALPSKQLSLKQALPSAFYNFRLLFFFFTHHEGRRSHRPRCARARVVRVR